MYLFKTDLDIYMYTGPHHIVKRVAAAVSAQGSVLNFDLPAANASWSTKFEGPVLRCETLSESEQLFVQRDIAGWLSSNDTLDIPQFFTPWSYRVWYGRFPHTAQDLVGIDAAFRLAILPRMYSYGTYDGSKGPWPKAYDYGVQGLLNQNASAPLAGLEDGSTMLECRLSRSTYHVDFNLVDGSQDLEISVPVRDWDAPSLIDSSVLGPNNASCLGVQDRTTETKLSSCSFNGTLIQQLSYRAIMDAVFEVLSGDIGLFGEWVNTTGPVTDTVFMNTNEFGYLATDPIGYLGSASLQSALRFNGGGKFLNSSADAPTGPDNLPLSRAIEEVFQNVTVSLMSLPQFQ